MNERRKSLNALLPLGMLVVFAGVGYGVWQAQGSAEAALEQDAGPYLDALVAGDWAMAAALDHSGRDLSPEILGTAWLERQGRFGDLVGWSIVVSNPGSDMDGGFILGTTQLVFSGRADPVPVRVELREDRDGAWKVARVVPTSRALFDEPVW